jgi:uncharacterized protein
MDTELTPRKPSWTNKLILFVSEACNLRCSYCYVMLGHEQRRPRLMRPDTARVIVRRAHAHLGPCKFIQFFGGEPTLNLPAIHAVVDEIRKMTAEGVLAGLPRFGIVTNGASRNMSAIIPFCKENNIAVTVSLDGPRHIHDSLRRNGRGVGSFAEATGTVKALLSAGVPVAIETVYTSRHIDEGCSIVDLFRFCHRLGVSKYIFHTVYPPAPPELCPFDDDHFGRLVGYHTEAVDWWFKSLFGQSDTPIDVYFKDLLLPILEGMAAGVSGGGCPAGQRDFTIGPVGDVYSCHLLYGDSRFHLGNILCDAIRCETGLPVYAHEIQKCTGCLARYWCQPCGALNLSWGNAWTPPERECELRRAVLTRISDWACSYLTVPENAMTRGLFDRLRASGSAPAEGWRRGHGVEDSGADHPPGMFGN